MTTNNSNILATTGNDGSYLSLLNPVSTLTGGVDKIPAMTSGVTGGAEGDWMLAKIGAVGLLALAAAATVRGLKQLAHTNKGDDEDNPAYRMQEQISSTVEPSLGLGKKAAEVPRPSWASMKNILYTALPLAAAYLGTYGGWKFMDSEIDESKENDLDYAIQAKHDKIWQLIKTRARLARGLASNKEVFDMLEDDSIKDSSYVQKIASLDKQASGEDVGRSAVTLSGLALLALIGVSAFGSYKYFKKTDENNARYKAIKKGLREYAKQRAVNTPITVNMLDEDAFIRDIEKGGSAKGASSGVRGMPEVSEPVSSISVTL